MSFESMGTIGLNRGFGHVERKYELLS